MHMGENGYEAPPEGEGGEWGWGHGDWVGWGVSGNFSEISGKISWKSPGGPVIQICIVETKMNKFTHREIILRSWCIQPLNIY